MRRARGTAVALLVALGGATPGAALASSARERAVEQIPELMGRILESQEEIRQQESEIQPVMARYDDQLLDARGRIEQSSSEEDAAEALVDYVEAYAARLESQETGLRAIEGSVVRMRADARELMRAAEVAGRDRGTPGEREAFVRDQFQGVASATAQLAERLGREEDAATAGAVLHASWASQAALELPLAEAGPDGAAAFARRVEGLYARHQARANQLRLERAAVRRLLDVLIERQLARRLETLFSDTNRLGLASLLSAEGKGGDWSDLGSVVSRALGLPSDAGAGAPSRRPSLGRLEYFAWGDHRE